MVREPTPGHRPYRTAKTAVYSDGAYRAVRHCPEIRLGFVRLHAGGYCHPCNFLNSECQGIHSKMIVALFAARVLVMAIVVARVRVVIVFEIFGIAVSV